ncbi:hypothetical protein LNP25_25450 [Klebsiella variicola subsp. variicola]|nr:hypothetical protein [Klebsiella variicola subsp. variicola]
MPLAVNVQIAGDCHGGKPLVLRFPSVPGTTDGEREQGGYRTFFAGIMCGSQHPDTCWRKKQRYAD